MDFQYDPKKQAIHKFYTNGIRTPAREEAISRLLRLAHARNGFTITRTGLTIECSLSEEELVLKRTSIAGNQLHLTEYKIVFETDRNQQKFKIKKIQERAGLLPDIKSLGTSVADLKPLPITEVVREISRISAEVNLEKGGMEFSYGCVYCSFNGSEGDKVDDVARAVSLGRTFHVVDLLKTYHGVRRDCLYTSLNNFYEPADGELGAYMIHTRASRVIGSNGNVVTGYPRESYPADGVVCQYRTELLRSSQYGPPIFFLYNSDNVKSEVLRGLVKWNHAYLANSIIAGSINSDSMLENHAENDLGAYARHIPGVSVSLAIGS